MDVLLAIRDFDKFVAKPTESVNHLPWMLWTPNNLAVAWPLLDCQGRFIAITLTLNAYYARGRTD